MFLSLHSRTTIFFHFKSTHVFVKYCVINSWFEMKCLCVVRSKMLRSENSIRLKWKEGAREGWVGWMWPDSTMLCTPSHLASLDTVEHRQQLYTLYTTAIEQLHSTFYHTTQWNQYGNWTKYYCNSFVNMSKKPNILFLQNKAKIWSLFFKKNFFLLI